MSPTRTLASTLALTLSLAACGPTSPPIDAPSDAPADAIVRTDTRVDVSVDAALVDTGLDIPATDNGTDVTRDGAPIDTGLDSPPTDSGRDVMQDALPVDTVTDVPPDVAPSDVLTTDAPVDARTDAGRFVVPSSCTADTQCGPDARCNIAINRCICTGSTLPCGESCCPWHYEVDATIATGGHLPEIGGDSAGNRYVLYKFGSNSVRLATIDAAATVRTVTVASSSGIEDDRDLAVAPDGTLYIAVHTDVGSRDGRLTLHRRAPGATTFTTMNLRTTYPTPFAYAAAVSISRASNGDIYAGTSGRYLDGTQGLAISRYDNGAGVWRELSMTALASFGISRSELFARADGFFLGATESQPAEFYFDFGPDVTLRSAIGGYVGPATGHGDTAAAMSAAGRLYVFASNRMDTSDRSLTETITFPTTLAGVRSDMDMATDVDGNPAILFHCATQHVVGLMVRMPHGGYTQLTLFDSFFLPAGTTSNWMTLDLERLPSGNLALAIGDSMDRGTFVYREIAR